MKKIIEVKLKIEYDEDPDLSWLGTISDKRKTYEEIPTNPNDILNTLWFAPANHLPHDQKNWEHVSEEEKQKVIEKYGSLRKADIEYAYEDCQRLLDHSTGKWWTEGYILYADIAVSEDGTHWACETINVSLRGIESDIAKEHKNAIIEDLKSELTEQLVEWGFNENEIKEHMTKVEEDR